MRKNSVPVMNPSSVSTRFKDVEIRKSKQDPELKKHVEGEMNGNKDINQQTNLPFSKEKTPAIATVDGMYGSTMYALKQKSAGSIYIANNYNTNTAISHERHDDGLV